VFKSSVPPSKETRYITFAKVKAGCVRGHKGSLNTWFYEFRLLLFETYRMILIL